MSFEHLSEEDFITLIVDSKGKGFLMSTSQIYGWVGIHNKSPNSKLSTLLRLSCTMLDGWETWTFVQQP